MNDKVETIIKKELQKGRRYFGSSGASLTYPVYDHNYPDREKMDVDLARQGLEGERRTSKRLLSYVKSKPNMVLVDSVHLKGMGQEIVLEDGELSGSDTDHVIVVGNQIILVDSKNWQKKRWYKVTEDYEVLRGNKPFPGGKVHSLEARALWQKFLQETPVSMIHLVVNITAEEVNIIRDKNWWRAPLKLVSEEELIPWLDKLYEYADMENEVINPDILAKIVPHCTKPYNEFERLFPEAMHLLKG